MFRMALAIAFALCLLIPSSGIAQPRQPKKKPDTVKLYREDTQFKEGEKVEITRLVPVMETSKSEDPSGRTVLKPAVGSTLTTIIVPLSPPLRWKLGAEGWFDEEGYNISKLLEIRSGGHLVPSALRSIKIMDDYGRAKLAILEPGDVIKSIDGYPITSPVQLYYAVNSAQNPRNLEIEWINCKNGDVMTGRVSAVKVTP